MQNLRFAQKMFSPFTVRAELIKHHVFFSRDRHCVGEPEIRNIFGPPRMFGISTMDFYKNCLRDEICLPMITCGTYSWHTPKQKKSNRNTASNAVRQEISFFSSEACLLSTALLASLQLFSAFLLPMR